MLVELWNSLQSVISSFRGKNRKRQQNRGQCSLLRGEHLEQRALLSANQINFDANLSAVMIEGSSGADSVTVWGDAANVYVSIVNASGTKSANFSRSIVTQVRFIGGDGDDTFSNTTSVSCLADGGAGNDILNAGLGTSSLYGGTGNDRLIGNINVDNLYGGDGDDYLSGGAGNDLLTGENGNDVLVGNEGDDKLYGGDGIDVLSGDAGNDLLSGGAGNDRLVGGDNDDSLYGEDGNDTLYGSAGNDSLNGGNGDDWLEGGLGNDDLSGQTGNDVMVGGLGQDRLYGGDGEDLLIGGTTAYDGNQDKSNELGSLWSSGFSYQSRVAIIENELSAVFLKSEKTVFDDQVADILYGDAQQDWFIETGVMTTYRPSNVEPLMPEHDDEGDHHSPISTSLPALEGFAFIDSLDKVSDRSSDEKLSSLIPHAVDPALQREHLSLYQLIRYDQVTNYAVSSGLWSNPLTWSNGVVPASAARVLIPVGVNVRVDGIIAARIATIRVDGKLSFTTSRDTELKVDTVIVTDSGMFEMGTAGSPIASGVSARLLITDNGPIDRTWDPFGISRGLISHGSVSIYGAEVASFAASALPVTVGNTALALKSVPSGWKAGDSIVIAATTGGAAQNEVRKIVAIVGTLVMLDQPLRYNHLSPAGDLDVHVANVTRNAVVESESTVADRRGHVMFMHNRDVHIGYAGFYKLGRTDKSKPVNDPVVNSDWTLKAGTGTNPRGRYAVHFHRNGVIDDGNPATIVGSAVVDSPGWGFVNHTSYVEMTENVAFDVHGAAFATEVGNEIGGFYRNIAIGATGTTEEINARQSIQDFGFQGDGFWFQGSGISVVGNIAAGNQESAFAYYTSGLIEGGVRQQFLSANLLDPAIAFGEEKIDIGSVPVRQFSNNIGYASHFGLFVRYHLETPQHNKTSTFENSSFWNNETGVYTPYVQHTIIRNVKVITNAATKPWHGVGVNIATQNLTYENLTIAGYFVGIELPRHGTNFVTGGTFNCEADLLLYTAAMSNRFTYITGVPATTKVALVADTNGFGPPASVFFVNDFILLNYGPFANQRLYFIEQQANYIPFPTARPDAPADYIGLTNRQLWDEFGVALGGAIVPANAVKAPTFDGWLAPA